MVQLANARAPTLAARGTFCIYSVPEDSVAVKRREASSQSLSSRRWSFATRISCSGGLAVQRCSQSNVSVRLRCQQQFGDQSSTSIVTILIAIIIVLGIAVVISFLVLGGDDKSGGASSTTTGGEVQRKVTKGPRPPSPPTMGPVPITVIPMTRKQRAVPDDLVCTLGAFSVINAMYPPDGLCNYLFYTHVIVFNKTELAGVEVNASWTLFKKEIAARSMTAGGVSFDFKYVTAQAFDDQALKKHLDKLASANIKNYGILNMVTSVKTWDDSMNRARGTIAKLKEIQGDDSNRKIVIALGLFDYNEPNAWDKYRKGFRDAVENTMADTVIAISSMSMVESSDTCYAAPTSVLDSSRLQDPARTTAKSYPDLKTHAALVSANVMYNKNSTRLGLSFEMGALFYSLNETTDSLEKRAYHPCERFYLTGLDIVILFTLTSLSRLSFTLNYSQLRIALLSFPPTYYPSLLSSSSSLSFYTPLLVVSL
ncbi:hypothetical protein MRX96_022518 [Rhipicephalus microplus]